MEFRISLSSIGKLKEDHGAKAPDLLMKVIDNMTDKYGVNNYPFDVCYITEEDIIDVLSSGEKKKALSRKLAISLIDYFNEYCGKKFKPEVNAKLVISLIESGYTENDIKRVIRSKYHQWNGSETLHHFIRPSTIFRRSNFENYVQEDLSTKEKEKDFSSYLDETLKG